MGKRTTILVLLVFIFIPITIVPFTMANSKETVYSTKDAYVDSELYSSNFGNRNYMLAGYDKDNSKGFWAYIYFNISEVTEGWHKVELYLYMVLSSDFSPYVVDLIICEHTSSWEEDTITFDNCPFYGNKLFPFRIDTDGTYKWEMNNWISPTDTFFSITIIDDLTELEYLTIYPREALNQDYLPRLVFKYPLSPLAIVLLASGVVGIIVGIGVVFYIKHKRYQKRKENFLLSKL